MTFRPFLIISISPSFICTGDQDTITYGANVRGLRFRTNKLFRAIFFSPLKNGEFTASVWHLLSLTSVKIFRQECIVFTSHFSSMHCIPFRTSFFFFFKEPSVQNDFINSFRCIFWHVYKLQVIHFLITNSSESSRQNLTWESKHRSGIYRGTWETHA